MSAEEVAKAFVPHYNNCFDNDASQLAPLFTAETMMTFEGQQFQGPQQIVEKLKSVGKVSHEVKSIDVQPSNNPNAILIFVTGAIKIDSNNPLHYCEMFQLVSTGPGAYYVHNCVFRLNYGL
mmetsp:Transcript_7759/g.21636  ORF Transcript_7759/g.21636 Transcript_7759/m.21636 type:complete len:122 (+) Transcript_7759:139-504(+)